MTPVRMYTLHERVWHWIQAFTIIVLLVTGAEVHAPQKVHLLGFQTAVITHNVFAGLLLLNAILGLFFFLTNGLIHHYMPGERGFYNLAFRQARYYLWGIFHGEPHPMEPQPDNRLNPLQKITYLMILNVLLPLQIGTGLLIWGAHYWPAFTNTIGGLPVLLPIHAIGSWFFLAFIIMHIYLTTTGHTPLANIKAMITGYHMKHNPGEDVESTEEQS